MWNHWAIRANHPHRPFTHFETNHWAWNHLRKQFPHALGAVLMPNHLHLILPHHSQGANRVVRENFVGFMGAISKKQGIPQLWQPISDPHVLSDRFHLKRTVRYVALNPCRRKLCADPLEWIWSTYRDIFGASVNLWLGDAKLARVLEESQRGFKVRFHAYVSGDPSVAIQGTPPPFAAIPKQMTEEPIRHIISAAAAALRVPSAEITKEGPLRNLFIQLAYRQGWQQTALLAKITGMSQQGLRGNIRRQPRIDLKAAALCLGDVRLRRLGLDNHPAFSSDRFTGAG